MGEHAARPDERLRTYYYHCLPPHESPPSESDSRRFGAAETFFNRLRRLPRFEVRLGKLARRDGRFEQKRVDILFAVDLVRMSWGRHIATAGLFTGDSDFVPAVHAAKDAGILVKLFYSRGAIHDELYEACDERIEMDRDWLRQFLLG